MPIKVKGTIKILSIWNCYVYFQKMENIPISKPQLVLVP